MCVDAPRGTAQRTFRKWEPWKLHTLESLENQTPGMFIFIVFPSAVGWPLCLFKAKYARNHLLKWEFYTETIWDYLRYLQNIQKLFTNYTETIYKIYRNYLQNIQEDLLNIYKLPTKIHKIIMLQSYQDHD